MIELSQVQKETTI